MHARMHSGQRRTGGSQFSISNRWVPGMETRPSNLVASTIIAEPSCQPPSVLFILPGIALSIYDLLCFEINFKIVFFYSSKE